MKKVILYIHGMGGSAAEARRFQRDCPKSEVIGIDYDGYLPWLAPKKIREVYDEISKKSDQISIIANSIGVYLGMLALQDCELDQALFISPMLDMEKYVLDKLTAAGFSEADLKSQKEIKINQREILSYKYLQFIREHPLKWEAPTQILYGEKDDHTPISVVNEFVNNHSAVLTVIPDGQHYFHNRQQLMLLDKWVKEVNDDN
ncbi:alpha/beta hydrolase [Lactobacillus halodurans]|uniref:Alpha/beta hydrolase n=1 Tax=Companilactobacillus halodurans TaxID=2584183 RepID=A0A5P0ZMK3_9LACO|nr:alpha/beta hydrolase [Companilactobacillus halodurans]MQS98609.1 alpha/beta hydrolase [Companilactobacillus halodurans]